MLDLGTIAGVLKEFGSLGLAAIFIWLYLGERNYNKELSKIMVDLMQKNKDDSEKMIIKNFEVNQKVAGAMEQWQVILERVLGKKPKGSA